MEQLRKDQETLTLEEANSLHLREIDAQALASEVERVWETIDSMRDAQIFTEETLAREISV
jgi:hypothetical protein